MTAWLVLAAIVLATAFVAAKDTPWLRIDDRAGTWVLARLAVIRTPWLTDVANRINGAGSGWGASVLGLSVVALTMAFRRWRHLAVFVGGPYPASIRRTFTGQRGDIRPWPAAVRGFSLQVPSERQSVRNEVRNQDNLMAANEGGHDAS